MLPFFTEPLQSPGLGHAMWVLGTQHEFDFLTKILYADCSVYLRRFGENWEAGSQYSPKASFSLQSSHALPATQPHPASLRIHSAQARDLRT